MKSQVEVLDLKDLTDENIEQYGLIIKNIREDFNSLVESAAENNNPYLLLSSVVSRESEYSPLFLRCCNLELIKFNIKNNLNINKIIIYDKQLFLIVKKYCSTYDYQIIIEYKKETNIPFLFAYLFLKNILRSFCIVFLTILAKLFTKKKIYSKKSPLILVSTHILKNNLKEYTKKSYKDRYYPNLYSYLDNTIEDNIFFVPAFPGGPLNYIELFKKLKLSDINFLLKGDILHLSDYLYAFCSSARVLFLTIPKTFFREVDVSSLIRTELRFFTLDYKIIEALLNFRFVYRLKQKKIDVSLFIDWYENHLSSKGFMLGFNTFMPNVKTVGYQGIIDSGASKINLHPTIFERQSMITPKSFCVIGEALIDDLKEFDKNISVKIAPSLRYNYLWENIPNNINFSNFFNILVALPISLIETKEILNLLHKTLKVLPSNMLINFRVKFHPTYNKTKIQKLLLINDNRIELISGDFIDFIYESNMLISGASTTCIEAMSIGVPVVVSGSKEGIMNISIPSSVSTDAYKIIRNEETLAEYISTLLNYKYNNYLKNSIKENYFKRPNKSSVASLFSNTNI